MADVNSFLKLIKMLESSGGKNTNHRTMTSGLHAGDTAVGSAGLMPQTAQEMAKRRISSGSADVNDQYVAESDSPTVESMLRGNEELQDRYVGDLANKVMTRAKGDPSLAATGWLYGHNLPYNKLEEKLEGDPTYKGRIDRIIGELGLMSNKPTYDIPALEATKNIQPKIDPLSKIKRYLK